MVESPTLANSGLVSMSVRDCFSDMQTANGIGAGEIGNRTRNP
jgi:hypothetical protein